MKLTGWKSDAAALLGGILLPFAFAPFHWWPVAIVSLLLFQVTLYADSLGRALWRALLFGMGYFGIGISWVFVSISLFGNATPPLAGAITALLILVMSGYLLLTTLLARKLQADGPVNLLVLPFVWTLVEWLRGWLFTGFGWLGIGYAFTDTPVAAYAPFVGVLGISFLVLLSSSLLLVMLGRASSIFARGFAGGFILFIWVMPLLIEFPPGTQMEQQPIQVALLQGNVPQHRKWQPSERQPTLDWYQRHSETHWDKQLIVWPETAIPAFEDQVADFLRALDGAARLQNTHIMLGIPVRETHGSRYYNALGVLGNPERGPESLYLKRHLVPFGEYLPFKALLDPVLGFLEIPMSNFSAGEMSKPLVTVGKYQAGVFICFEIAFAGEVREALPEAAYLVNISNDAWFGDSLAPAQHLQMARMRALETGRYVLRATNTGISAIIKPDGNLQQVLPQFQSGVLAGTIQPAHGATWYSRLGDYPILVVVMIFLAGWWRYASR